MRSIRMLFLCLGTAILGGGCSDDSTATDTGIQPYKPNCGYEEVRGDPADFTIAAGEHFGFRVESTL